MGSTLPDFSLLKKFLLMRARLQQKQQQQNDALKTHALMRT